MESDEIREQIRAAERAAAAPHIANPRSPWWHAFLLSLSGPLLVLVITQSFAAFTGRASFGSLPALAVALIALFVILDQRKRRGVTAKGRAPRELQKVYRWYFIGAILVSLGVFALALTTVLWVSLPASFVLCFVALTWFGIEHERAAKKVRVRLA